MRWLVLVLVLVACSASDDVPAPQLGSVTPSAATSGAVVMLTGDYFCQRPDTGNEDPICASTGTVDFGASPGTVTSWTDTAIMVEVPSGLHGSVALSVIVNGRSSNPISFGVQ